MGVAVERGSLGPEYEPGRFQTELQDGCLALVKIKGFRIRRELYLARSCWRTTSAAAEVFLAMLP